jgi:hypothetical protein
MRDRSAPRPPKAGACAHATMLATWSGRAKTGVFTQPGPIAEVAPGELKTARPCPASEGKAPLRLKSAGRSLPPRREVALRSLRLLELQYEVIDRTRRLLR